jgi:membrane associated rhomboid family serine protease
MFQSLPPVIKNLVIINAIVFVFLFWASGNAEFAPVLLNFMLCKSDLIFSRPMFEEMYAYGEFKPLQLVTHFFSHKEIFHILFNMMALTSLGSGVEYVMGSKRFLEFYLFCGFVGGLIIAFLDPSNNPVLGASGAISGVIVAFAFLFPKEKLSVFFLPPIEARWVATGIGVLSLVFVLIGGGGFISHFGHLAGMVAALIYFGFYKVRAHF